jgi:hypothetical protein
MTYVTYTRSESGTVTRDHNRIQLAKAERTAQYPHAEKLLGWAERMVYWSSQTGAAIGVAAVTR